MALPFLKQNHPVKIFFLRDDLHSTEYTHLNLFHYKFFRISENLPAAIISFQ